MKANLDKSFREWVSELKAKIQTSQMGAALAVNRELLMLYWEIGQSISAKLADSDWGSGVVEDLSNELRKAFPNQKGFSRSNLFSMKKWVEFYAGSESHPEKVQRLVGQIPWGHNVALISKCDTVEEALFYASKTVENNWSRAVLVHQMESGLIHRLGSAVTNFENTLPSAHSELAQQTLKDPYKLDFLNLHEKMMERDIEEQLMEHITQFLLELGAGFSFVGRQVPLRIDGKDFRIDLLFYHIKLKCYVAVDLKITEFKAEHTGKMNLYISAIDDQIRGEGDNPTIGLLLCKSKSEVMVKYSLRGIEQPIGIAEYELEKSIPKELKSALSTLDEIEEELKETDIEEE